MARNAIGIAVGRSRDPLLRSFESRTGAQAQAIGYLNAFRSEQTDLAGNISACRDSQLADIEATLNMLDVPGRVLPNQCLRR